MEILTFLLKRIFSENALVTDTGPALTRFYFRKLTNVRPLHKGNSNQMFEWNGLLTANLSFPSTLRTNSRKSGPTVRY